MDEENNKKIIGAVFLVVLMFGFISAETNVSILYGANSSGAIVPAQIDDGGYLKVDLDFLNISAGDIAASGNLTLGEKITFTLGEMVDNIVDLDNGLEIVNEIQPRRFTWKASGEGAIGFIAQELNEFYPQAVSVPEDEEKMWGVDYGKLTPVLVKSIQELSAENDALKEAVCEVNPSAGVCN